MLLKKIILVLVFISSNLFYSQKLELGSVTIDELNEVIHPKDSSAPAKIIFERGKTSFQYNKEDGFKLVTEVEVKIKIYKKEGYSWANKQVPFYVGGVTFDKVDFSKAITYNLVNGKIEKTKLKSDGEFVEKSNKLWSLKKITMPNVKEGSIIEYKYVISSPYLSTFPEWNFQNSIPTDYSEYTTQIPEYFTYNVHRKGFLIPKEVISKENKTLRIINKELELAGRNTKYVTTEDEKKYIELKTIYTLGNSPAIIEEDFVNNINNYVTSVQHELSSKQLSINEQESFATSWEDVVKSLYDDDNFGIQLNKNNYFESDITTVVSGLTTNEEKMTAIYKFVQSRMNWDSYTDYRCDKGVKKAYQEKTGNSAEINLILTAMFRYAGLDANPVLVSTRANGISIYPSRTAYNNVIAAVKLGDDVILLDATSKYAVPNVLPLRNLNWYGRLIRKDKTSDIINLMPINTSKRIINTLVQLSNEGTLSGNIKEQYFDYNALTFRDNYLGINTESYIDILEQKSMGVDIENYEVTNGNILNEPVIEKYSIKCNNCVDVIGDKIYFSPMLYFAQNKNPFTQDKRDYPIDFKYPNQDKYLISIVIPEGYSIESIPNTKVINMVDNLATFKYLITNTDKKIQLSVQKDINSSIFSSEYYEDLKLFFAEMIKIENQKIVIKKN